MKKIFSRIRLKLAPFSLVFIVAIFGTVLIAGAAGSVYCSKAFCVKKLSTEVTSNTISSSVPVYGGQNAEDLAIDDSGNTYSSDIYHYLIAYCPSFTSGSSHDFYIFPYYHKLTFTGKYKVIDTDDYYFDSRALKESNDGYYLDTTFTNVKGSKFANINYHYKIYQCTGGYQTGYMNGTTLGGDSDGRKDAYISLGSSNESGSCGVKVYVAESHDEGSITYEHNIKGMILGNQTPADENFDWYSESFAQVETLDEDGNIVEPSSYLRGFYIPPRYTCTRVINCTTCGMTDWKECGYAGWSTYYCKSNDENTHRQFCACDTCGYVYHDYNEEHTFASNDDYTSISATQHQHTETCTGKAFTEIGIYSKCTNKNCGYTKTVTEDHNWEYTYTAVDSKTHKYTRVCKDCGYSDTTVYTETHCDENDDNICDKCNYAFSVFSVTVPTTMTISMDKNGEIYTAENLKITNNSTDTVEVKEIKLNAAENWTIVPYSTNMANKKVDSKLVGIKIRDSVSDETSVMTLTGNWTIDKNESMDLPYDAVVSATSSVVTDEEIMTVIFVVEWSDE